MRVLDLGRRAWTRQKGDITLIGTWILIDGRHRPCMAIIRTGDEFSDDIHPCIVTVDQAWIWNGKLGDEKRAADTLAGFIDPLRLTPNTRDIVRLYNLIYDHLDDLLHIKPYVAAESQVVAEMIVTDQAGKTREIEVREDV